MDINSLMQTMLAPGSVAAMSKKTGASADTVSGILSAALPTLLNGIGQQAQGKDTQAGFAQALSDHAKDDTDDIASFMDGVDLSDGSKILEHLLGGKLSSTQKQLAGQSGTDSRTTSSVLSAAAPLLMSLLGKQTQTEASGNDSAALVGSLVTTLLKNVDVSELLGGLMSAVSTDTSAGKSKSSSAKSSSSRKKTAAKKNDSAASLIGDVLSTLLSGKK